MRASIPEAVSDGRPTYTGPIHSPSVHVGSASRSSIILPKFSSVFGSWTIAKYASLSSYITATTSSPPSSAFSRYEPRSPFTAAPVGGALINPSSASRCPALGFICPIVPNMLDPPSPWNAAEHTTQRSGTDRLARVPKADPSDETEVRTDGIRLHVRRWDGGPS